VLDSNQGVEPQTETVWRQGDKYKVPRIVFANKMDKVGADFFKCLDDIVKRLGARPVAIQLPIGSEADFKGCIDLVQMKAIVWHEEDKGATFDIGEIPEKFKAQADEYRAALIEAAHAAARSKGTYLAAQYRRLAARRGGKRAAVAVGHSILVSVYHLLRDQERYHDLGANYFDERDRLAVERRLIRRLEALGHKVTLEPAA